LPYYITNKSADCPAWAVVKEDGELLACHDTKQSAIDQAIAVSLSEETEFLGERAAVGQLQIGDYVSWDITDPNIMAEVVMVQGELAVVELYELEDDVYHSTERLIIVNVFKLQRVTRPDLISEKVEEEEPTKLEDDVSRESEKMAKIEKRTNPVHFELREVEGSDGMTFTGYAAVFNAPSEPLPFTERIAPGAFKRSLRARNDIKLLWNHDTGQVLGSTRAGTLKLEEDTYGLRVTAVLPDTTLGRDVRTLVQRGDVNAMSFGFSVPANGDSWNTEGTERTLRSVRIHEVSIVAFPAYQQTSGTASVRSYDAAATRAEVDADQLADAFLAIEDGKDLTLEQSELLTKVIQRLTPQQEAELAQDSGDLTALELKKKKIELLLKRI
jgi:uncharacterized protein